MCRLWRVRGAKGTVSLNQPPVLDWFVRNLKVTTVIHQISDFSAIAEPARNCSAVPNAAGERPFRIAVRIDQPKTERLIAIYARGGRNCPLNTIWSPTLLSVSVLGRRARGVKLPVGVVVEKFPEPLSVMVPFALPVSGPHPLINAADAGATLVIMNSADNPNAKVPLVKNMCQLHRS